MSPPPTPAPPDPRPGAPGELVGILGPGQGQGQGQGQGPGPGPRPWAISSSISASISASSWASLLLSSRCFISTATTTLMSTNWAVSTKLTKYRGDTNCRLLRQLRSSWVQSRSVSYHRDRLVRSMPPGIHTPHLHSTEDAQGYQRSGIHITHTHTCTHTPWAPDQCPSRVLTAFMSV